MTMSSSPDPESKEFSFTSLAAKFEALSKKTQASGGPNGIIPLADYADAMSEFTKVFGALGSGFAFAFKDLDEKLETLKAWAPIHGDIGSALARDVESNNMPPSDKGTPGMGKCSSVRAVNRSTHVCVFLTALFEEIMKNPDKELKACLNTAYEPTLQRIHKFIVRNSVKLAFNLVPSRAKFMESVQLREEELKTCGPSFVAASKMVTGLIEQEFSKKQINFIF